MSELSYTCQNAILLLFFNRLDTIEHTLSQIAQVKPPRIYLAQDGAKTSSQQAKIKKVRDFILGYITWDCEIHTRFLDSNHGCKIAVSSAISWFFSHEEQGIILEDDCLPSISFFRFCDELLERYKNTQEIFMISGWSAFDFAPNKSTTTLSPKAALKEDYFFSKYNHIWGWASWARAWRHYQIEFENFEQEFSVLHNFSSPRERYVWYKIFKAYHQGKIDTWDYPWTYSIWKHNALCVYPKNNMILNIGFNRSDAAHTTEDSHYAYMPTYELVFPLIHPVSITQNKAYDILNFQINFNIPSLPKRAYNKLKRIYRNFFHTHKRNPNQRNKNV